MKSAITARLRQSYSKCRYHKLYFRLAAFKCDLIFQQLRGNNFITYYIQYSNYVVIIKAFSL
jgi:hypothetical protein